MQDNFAELYAIFRPSAAFHLRVNQFAVKLKRNHSERSGFPPRRSNVPALTAGRLT